MMWSYLLLSELVPQFRGSLRLIRKVFSHFELLMLIRAAENNAASGSPASGGAPPGSSARAGGGRDQKSVARRQGNALLADYTTDLKDLQVGDFGPTLMSFFRANSFTVRRCELATLVC
jgi:hypothetical protein